MALGSWEDFTSKWGFNEGASTESRDYEARSLIVAELNEMTAVKAAKIRMVEYDRPGLHNSCLILIFLNAKDRTDAELLADWKAGKVEEVDVPVSVSEAINEVVSEVYASLSPDESDG